MAEKSKTGKTKKKLLTPVFRLSFPNLFEPRAVEGDANSKPKYGLSAVWTPAKFTAREKEQWRAMLAEMDRVARETFHKPWKDLPDNIRRGIRDGSAKEGLDGYGEGTRFANITSKNRPGVIDRDGERIGPEWKNADKIYPGCYCQATVTVYAYNNKGKGIALGLRNVRKVADGARLDNYVAAEDDFDEEIESQWLEMADDNGGTYDDDDDDADDVPF